LVGPQSGDLLLEVVQRVERPVNAREAQIRHFVQLAQRAQDGQADLVAGHLGRAPRPDRLLHPLGEQRDVILVDRPTLARLAHPGRDLLPAERLGDTAALDHREDRLLDGGEPPTALRAGPAATDQLTVVGLARVDHPGIRMATVRAAHRSPPLY